MNPVLDFLQEKRGSTFSNAQHIPKMFGDALITGTAAAGAGAVMAGAGIAAAQLYNAATKSRDFRRMLEHNPDLVQEHENDPKHFNQLFSSLRSVNTSFSRDPIIAGTYMRRMVGGSQTAGGVLTDALGFRGEKETPSFGHTMLQSGLSGAKAKLPKEKDDPLEPRRAALEEQEMGLKEHEVGQKHRQMRHQQQHLPGFP